MITENFNCGEIDLLYSSEDFKRVNNLFEVQTTLMCLVGLNPKKLTKFFPKNIQSFGSYLVKIYSFLIVLNSFFFAVLHLKTTYDKILIKDLEGMSDALTMLLIYSVACFSTVYFLWNLNSLLKFIDDINRYYRHHSMAGLTFASYYKPYYKIRRYSVIWVMTCFSGVTTWAMAPIILSQRTLPLKCWYPYDVMAPKVYEINYFIQVFGQINTGCTFSVCSGLFLTFVVLFLTQFDILYCSIKNLNYHAKLLCGENLSILRHTQSLIPFRETDELNQYFIIEEYKTDLNVFKNFYIKNHETLKQKSVHAALHESLVECIKHHRFLLKSCLKLEDFINPYNLVISMQVIIQLCTLVFAAVTGEPSTMRVFNQIQYFILTLINMVIFTYSGELLRQQSVRSSQAFWRSDWSPFNMNSLRKDLMIFLINSNRVVRLTAGKFYAMDIVHLRKALTQVFSLFTLLRKLYDRKI